MKAATRRIYKAIQDQTWSGNPIFFEKQTNPSLSSIVCPQMNTNIKRSLTKHSFKKPDYLTQAIFQVIWLGGGRVNRKMADLVTKLSLNEGLSLNSVSLNQDSNVLG